MRLTRERNQESRWRKAHHQCAEEKNYGPSAQAPSKQRIWQLWCSGCQCREACLVNLAFILTDAGIRATIFGFCAVLEQESMTVLKWRKGPWFSGGKRATPHPPTCSIAGSESANIRWMDTSLSCTSRKEMMAFTAANRTCTRATVMSTGVAHNMPLH